jgi:hypothetical protein
MDADDVALRDRFATQASFLDRKPWVGIVGSSILFINEKGYVTGHRGRPEGHKGIKYASLYSTPMYHPTVMGRASIFKSYHYSEALSNSEDYELWSRLLFETEIKFANIHKPLLKHRLYPQSFTTTLNLDKRALSAHNTLQNLEHYTSLSEREKRFVLRLRQEQSLRASEVLVGLWLYLRITFSFIRRENPGIHETLEMWVRYSRFVLILFKFEFKKLILRR